MDDFNFKPKDDRVTVEIRIAGPNGQVSVLHGLVQEMNITKELGAAIYSIGQAGPFERVPGVTRFEIKGIAMENPITPEHKIKEGRWANIIDEL